MQQKNPLVSIIMLTYNHEKFIEQAVLAVLNQKTDFAFELIVANDNSPDHTEEIINNIASKHPKGDCIVYYRNEPNLGVMPNSKKALDMAKGRYLALCEGDDYWTNEHKLQKQIDFLETNPNFSICFHNTRIEFFEGNGTSYLLNEKIEKDVFTIDDLIGEDEIWFMATASLVLRKSAFGKTPDWLTQSKSGDIPILILTARNGKIKYLPDEMAVYRKHADGVSLTDHKDDALFLRNRIFMYEKLNEETNYKYKYRFNRNISRYYFMLLESKQYKSKYLAKLPIVFKYIQLTFPKLIHYKELFRDHILPPFVMKTFRFMKNKLGLIPV